MRIKNIFLFAFMLISIGLKANDCYTATTLTVKDSLVPDTFQFSGTEYWFAVTGNQETSFYINNFINGTYAGITQVDLYSGTCGGRMVNHISLTEPDTLFYFRHILVSGTQYYLRLIRPSGLDSLYFTVIGATGPPPPPDNCPPTPCDFIINGGFDTWGITPDPSYFTNANNLVLFSFCSWKPAWRHPNITGNLSNPILHMWAQFSNFGGEAVVTEPQQLLNDATYTIEYDYYVHPGGVSGKLEFILSSQLITAFPDAFGYGNVLYDFPLYVIPEATAIITSSTPVGWHHYSNNFTLPHNGIFNTLVIDPKSDDNNVIHVSLDNVRITESYTANITAVTGNGVTLTANPIQTPQNGPYTYLWNTTETTQSINVTTSGLYSVTITNLIGCTAIAQYNVVVTTPMTCTTNATSTGCGLYDGTATVYVNGVNYPPYTYHWIGPNGFSANTQSIINVPIGAYSVTVTNSQSSTWTGSQLITEDIFAAAQWPFKTNSVGSEEIHDMATDINGNLYVIGTFTNSLDFGNGIVLTNNMSISRWSIFVAKFDKCGNVLIAKNYGYVALTVDLPGVGNYHIERFGSGQSSYPMVISGEFSKINFVDPENTSSPYVINAQGTTVDVFLAFININTLLSSPTQYASMGGPGIDFVKGISVTGSDVYIAGGFNGGLFYLSNGTPSPAITNSTSYTDFFLGNFFLSSNNLVFDWAKGYPGVWSDNGMAMQIASPNLFVTHKFNSSTTVENSYIRKFNQTGTLLSSEIIGTTSDLYVIHDMLSTSTGLYLCGYRKSSSTSISEKQAAIIYYPNPNSAGVAWANANVRLSPATTTPPTMCEATKLLISGSNVMASGTYNYNDFKIGYALGPWSQTIPEYGTTNHFVYKTNLTLDPLVGWLTGAMANSSANGFSRANSIYAGKNSTYYLGGAYNGQVVLNLTNSQQWMVSYSTNPDYDGFIGRLIDNGGAEFVRLANPNQRNDSKRDINVYPNPANNNVYISAINDDIIKQISVIDIAGNELFLTSYDAGTINETIDVSFLQQGTYFIKITTNNNVSTKKIVIVR